MRVSKVSLRPAGIVHTVVSSCFGEAMNYYLEIFGLFFAYPWKSTTSFVSVANYSATAAWNYVDLSAGDEGTK